jgi:hypothetical protein
MHRESGWFPTYSSQWTSDVEQTQSTRYFGLLVPAPNAIDDARICNTSKYSTEESDDINMFDILRIRRQKSENSPNDLESWDQDVRPRYSKSASFKTQGPSSLYRTLVNRMLEGIIAAQYPAWKTPVVYCRSLPPIPTSSFMPLT